MMGTFARSTIVAKALFAKEPQSLALPKGSAKNRARATNNPARVSMRVGQLGIRVPTMMRAQRMTFARTVCVQEHLSNARLRIRVCVLRAISRQENAQSHPNLMDWSVLWDHAKAARVLLRKLIPTSVLMLDLTHVLVRGAVRIRMTGSAVMRILLMVTEDAGVQHLDAM
jgi:hypothetical protein